MTVSPKRQARQSNDQQAQIRDAKKRHLKRALRLETLERRELMATDLVPFHNYLIPHDVDGDFSVTPLDALAVVNRINSQGPGELKGAPANGDRTGLVDVDKDNFLSPLDVLSVVNRINMGEGADPQLVRMAYRFYAYNPATGQAGAELPDPDPTNGIPEATIGTGDRVIVRTTVRDLRGAAALGVFSGYHELNYSNADNSTDERLQFQWGEFNEIRFANTITPGGSFQLRFTSPLSPPITTAAISPVFVNGVFRSTETAAAIDSALEAVFGSGNVSVRRLPAANGATTLDFGISFLEERARTDIADGEVINNTFAGAAITYVGLQNPNPNSQDVAFAGIRHGVPNGSYVNAQGDSITKPAYGSGPDGLVDLSTPRATRTISRLGGFVSPAEPMSDIISTDEFFVVDTLFVGAAAGVINLNGSITPNLPQTRLGVSVIGADAVYLGATQVDLPEGIIRIADNLTAVTDVFSFNEDLNNSVPNNVVLDVIANDLGRNSSGAIVPANTLGTTITAVTQPLVGGTVSIVSNSTRVQFSPTADYNGPVVFTYSIANSFPATSTGTVTINLDAVNDPPRIVSTSFSVAEDTPVPGLVLTPTQVFNPGPQDEVASGQTVSFSNPRSATNGTVSLVAGNINFVPTGDYVGPASFVVDAVDSASGATNNVTVSINVTPVNDAPTIVQTSFTIAEDSGSLTVTPTQIFAPGPANESTQTLTLSKTSDPAQGTATITNGNLVFTPAPNFFGIVNIGVSVIDNGQTNGVADPKTTNAVLTVTVTPTNDAPDAVNDVLAVNGTPTPQPLNVLANDTPGIGESVAVGNFPADTVRVTRIVTQPSPGFGTLTVPSGGANILFTPLPNVFDVTFSFTYEITDTVFEPGGSAKTDTATVQVYIAPPARPYALDDTFSVAEDSGTTTLDVLDNDFFNANATESLVSFTAIPANQGTLVRNANNPNLLSFTPALDFFGNVQFSYVMADNGVQDPNRRTEAFVTVNVTPVNDPPQPVNRSATGREDEVLVVSGATILDQVSSGPGESDTLTITNAEVISPAGAGTASAVNGNVRFAPTQNFNGVVEIRYTVTDSGTPAQSATATLTVTMNPVNDNPVALNKTIPAFKEDSSATISIDNVLLVGATSGAANENQTVSFVPLNGTVSTANGSVRQVGRDLIYTPNADYFGTDSFVYQVTDGQSENAIGSATVSLTIFEENDAPTATTLSRSVFASVPTNFNLTDDLAAMPKGPSNESNQSLRVRSIVPVGNAVGTAVVNANGTITYTAPLGSSGAQTFRYTVEDNGTTNGVSDPKTADGTFNINILPFIPSSFRGVVYVDSNRNEIPDANELRVGGADVTLTIAPDPNVPGSTEIKETYVTGADGSYSFDLLPPGTYTVSYALPILSTDGVGPNSVTRVIAAPGDVNTVLNFALSGISATYSDALEYLSSSYYASNSSLRNSGIYAAIGADGKSEWTIMRDGFAGETFHEVVMSNDGRAILTSVRGADRGVYTATLGRSQFVQVLDQATGQRLVRVLARSSDLTWTRTSLSAPRTTVNARKYLEAVDEFFASQGW